jgi:hypothetical protein
MMNAVVERNSHELAQPQAFSLAPRNLDEAFRLADMLADSDLVPKDFKGKPGNVMIAMQWGMEVGLKPLQALQNIAVINGRPSMWGDAVLALVRASPLCEYVLEEEDGSGTAVCRAKRRGEPEQIRTFSNVDAKTAGLLNKAGPWTTSPKRMKQMRARSFALRDVFADVLKGMDVTEVVLDLPPLNAAPTGGATQAAPPDALLKQAQEAAGKGVVAYEAFWQSIGKDNRHSLGAQHPELKLKAQQADAARTVENESAAGPAVLGREPEAEGGGHDPV